MSETNNEKKDFTQYEYYRNRELSWLAFNERVLAEARDKMIPLLERCKFLGITGSNLDEFIMVRVGTLRMQMQSSEESIENKTVMNSKEQVKEIR